MSDKAESDLAARGRALPQGQELIYLSKPTPTSQRWVFQGSGPVLLSYVEALGHILTVEAESVLCDGVTGRREQDGAGFLMVCSTCGHRWDRSTWIDWSALHLPRHWKATSR